jgi:hypothetical protein
MYVKESRTFTLAILLLLLSCGAGYAQSTGAIVGAVKGTRERWRPGPW